MTLDVTLTLGPDCDGDSLGDGCNAWYRVKRGSAIDMRAYVDEDLCIGCGFCAGVAPEVFEMNDAGKAVAVADTTDDNRDSVQEAIDGCPVSAIREEE